MKVFHPGVEVSLSWQRFCTCSSDKIELGVQSSADQAQILSKILNAILVLTFDLSKSAEKLLIDTNAISPVMRLSVKAIVGRHTETLRICKLLKVELEYDISPRLQ